MDIKLYWFADDGIRHYAIRFMQAMISRLAQGHYRYGVPNRREKYLTKIKLEIEAYEKQGNIEHLFNAANYCLLETIAPEHKKSHADPYAPSVTRGKIK